MELKYELVIPESREIKYSSSNSWGVVTDLEIDGEYNGYPILKGIFKGKEANRLFHCRTVNDVEQVVRLYGVKQWELDQGSKIDATCG